MADQHAPGLPEIHDEAADTPMWLPLLGLALLIVASLFFIIRAATADTDAAAEAPALGAELGD